MLKKYPRIVVVEDDVYEGLTFDDYYQKDLPKMSFIDGMYDRTLSVYSGGKIFACTGSRVGWVVGPAYLIKPLMSVHQYNVFCQYDPVQTAMAESLDFIGQSDYMKEYADKLIHNRSILIDQLLNSRFDLRMWIPKGGYFIMTDISKIPVQEKYMIDEKTQEKRTKDMAFCIQMARELGVVAIPCSSFYDLEDIKLGENMVRFAFCKE
jgi:aspartate/methionine/tyrosine aminotransferase